MTTKTEYLGLGDVNPMTFAGVLLDKIRIAGSGGIVHLMGGVFHTYNTITLPQHIKTTIRGEGQRKTTIKLISDPQESKEGSPGLINIGCNETVIKYIRVDTDEQMLFHNGSCAINTNGYSDVVIHDAEIVNSGIGLGTPDNQKGLIPHGLICVRNTFRNCKHGILFNRVMSANDATWIKQITINNCYFLGKQDAGISFDCGNDGIDGNPNLKDKRSKIGMETVSNLDKIEIVNCEFAKAEKYNLALAKVWNVKVVDNIFKGAKELYGESINIEHESHDIVIENNLFDGNSPGVEQSHISILTFRDYEASRRVTFGSDPRLFYHEDGCHSIKILNNKFKGNVKNFIYAEYSSKIDIIGNRTTMFVNLRNRCSFWHCSEINFPWSRTIFYRIKNENRNEERKSRNFFSPFVWITKIY